MPRRRKCYEINKEAKNLERAVKWNTATRRRSKVRRHDLSVGQIQPRRDGEIVGTVMSAPDSSEHVNIEKNLYAEYGASLENIVDGRS